MSSYLFLGIQSFVGYLFSNAAEWYQLPAIITHEWWHAVQFRKHTQLMKRHQELLSRLSRQNVFDSFLEWISPAEVEARIFERKYTNDPGYLHTHKRDYDILGSRRFEDILDIVRRQEVDIPFWVSDDEQLAYFLYENL